MSTDTLTPEQEAAIALMKAEYGDKWKDQLADEWWDGYTFRTSQVFARAGSETCYLQQIRNRLGPRWLAAQPL